MIARFRNADAKLLWETGRSKSIPASIRKVAIRKLTLLDIAVELGDLLIPPGNRMESLKADRKGQHSIRINDQYRICFVWRDGNAHDVEIVDDHETTHRRHGSALMPKLLLPTVHPGEILREEFLAPMGITPYRLAHDIHVPVTRINDIALERRAVSADTALRLGKYFGMTAQFWINAQALYDLRTAANKAQLDDIVPYREKVPA